MSQLSPYTICNDHYIAIDGEMHKQSKALNGGVSRPFSYVKRSAGLIEILYEKK